MISIQILFCWSFSSLSVCYADCVMTETHDIVSISRCHSMFLFKWIKFKRKCKPNERHLQSHVLLVWVVLSKKMLFPLKHQQFLRNMIELSTLEYTVVLFGRQRWQSFQRHMVQEVHESRRDSRTEICLTREIIVKMTQHDRLPWLQDTFIESSSYSEIET